MKQINEELKEDIFEKKIQVELSLGEVAIIYAVLGKTTTNYVQNELNERGLEELIVYKDKNDLSYSLYSDALEILKQHNLK